VITELIRDQSILNKQEPCELCQVVLESRQDFVDHVGQSDSHKAEVKKFMSFSEGDIEHLS